jgi:hypothetical protein
MKIKTLVETDYHEIDELINTHFPCPGHNYESIAFEEWGNSESHTFNVEKGPLDRNDSDSLRKWAAGDWKSGMFRLRVFLNELCNRDIIQPGEYLVKIS